MKYIGQIYLLVTKLMTHLTQYLLGTQLWVVSKHYSDPSDTRLINLETV